MSEANLLECSEEESTEGLRKTAVVTVRRITLKRDVHESQPNIWYSRLNFMLFRPPWRQGSWTLESALSFHILRGVSAAKALGMVPETAADEKRLESEVVLTV